MKPEWINSWTLDIGTVENVDSDAFREVIAREFDPITRSSVPFTLLCGGVEMKLLVGNMRTQHRGQYFAIKFRDHRKYTLIHDSVASAHEAFADVVTALVKALTPGSEEVKVVEQNKRWITIDPRTKKPKVKVMRLADGAPKLSELNSLETGLQEYFS